MIDPFSITMVAVSALASATARELISTRWERLHRRLRGKHEITISSPTGQQVRVDTSKPMTEDRIKEIVAGLK